MFLIASILRFVIYACALAFVAGVLALLIFTAHEVFGWDWYEGREGVYPLNDFGEGTTVPGTYWEVMRQYALMTLGFAVVGGVLFYFFGDD